MASPAAKKASIYRMVMPTHVCPFGLKAADLLRREGYPLRLQAGPITRLCDDRH